MKNSVKHQYKRTQQSIVFFIVAVSLALMSATAFASTNIPAFLSEQVNYASPVGALTLTGIQLIDPSGKCSSVSVTVAGKVTGTKDDGGGKDVITFQLWDDGTLKDSGDISVTVGQTIDFSVTLDFAGLYGHSAPGVGVYSGEVGLRVDPFYPTDRDGTCGGVLTVTPTNRDVGKDAGTTTFSVSNTGAGDMPWTAEVLLGGAWLSITSGVSGTNAGTVTCAFAANTGTTVRTGTILLTSVGATGSPQKVTVTQDPEKQTKPSALLVDPTNRDVENVAGTTSFSVSNTGDGEMPWSAKVSDGAWLSIKSGSSGDGAGTITCAFDANTSTSVRTGKILVTATGATGSPQEVTVKQAGQKEWTISGNVKTSSAVVSGVKIAFSGSGGGETTTDSSGNYKINVPDGYSGAATPSKTGFTFKPASRDYSKVTASKIDEDYIASDGGNPILEVDPTNQNVGKDAGTTTFSVSNTGTGDMPWTAAVSDGAWLSIKSGASGSNAGTIACAFEANTGTTVRTGTILVTAVGATGSPQRVTVTQASPSPTPSPTPSPSPSPTPSPTPSPVPALSVNPTNRDVASGADTTDFSVSNTGAGDMPWTAKVISGDAWLSIKSGASGSNAGTITCAFDANTSTSYRTGKVQVTAPGATGSPQEVTVKQAGQKQWTISGNVKTSSAVLSGVKITFSSGGGETTTDSSGNYSVIVSDGYSGTATPSKTGFTFNPASRNYSKITASKTGEDYVASGGDLLVGSNSIEDIDVVKITDMSGSLPAGGGAVTVKAWDQAGKELSEAGSALPITVSNHGTTSIQCADLEGRFPGGAPAAYTFLVKSSKMFITNVNNSSDMAVKVPIIFTNGLSNFASNSIGSRNTIKVTDMSGTIGSNGVEITITAWDTDGKAIPESTSAAPLKLYSHGTTTFQGASLPARFPTGTPMTYEFTIASPKLIVSNVKNSADGNLNIPTVYTIGVNEFVSNSIGSRNTIYISDFSGSFAIGGAAINVRAWDASGKEIHESDGSSYKIFNYETVKITGAELASRFSSGSPITYEFTVDSPNIVITNVKSSTDESINIPTVYTRGITKYTTNYVSDLNIIQITDMSGGVLSGGAITILARDVEGRIIPEDGGATELKLVDHGTTIIEGSALQNRFPGGVPVTYEFSIGSSSVVVTNITKSTVGTINIPTVFTLGPYGGI
jgi:hypothetical protein